MHNAKVLVSKGWEGRDVITYPAKFNGSSSFHLCFVGTIHVYATSAPLVLNGMSKTWRLWSPIGDPDTNLAVSRPYVMHRLEYKPTSLAQLIQIPTESIATAVTFSLHSF